VLTWCRGHLISKAELLGTGVGFVGTAVLASGAASEAEVKLLGDLAALTASCAFVPYLLIGRRLRSWMPLWVYAAPVTALAASELTLAAALLEGSRPFVPGRNGLFGWLASLHYLPFVAYLGIVPGIVGHTGINALLRHINPLVITLALNVEPVLGSVMGALVGVTSPPGVLSYAGGALIVVSTVVVSVGSARREEEERQRTAAAHEVKTIMMTPLDDL